MKFKCSTYVTLQCEQSDLIPIVKSNHQMLCMVNIVPIHVTANKPFHFNDFWSYNPHYSSEVSWQFVEIFHTKPCQHFCCQSAHYYWLWIQITEIARDKLHETKMVQQYSLKHSSSFNVDTLFLRLKWGPKCYFSTWNQCYCSSINKKHIS